MPLLITPRCCCIRSASGLLLAQCSRCRAKDDPEFRDRCDTALNPKPSPPKRAKKRARNRKETAR